MRGRGKSKYIFAVLLALILVVCYLNQKYEVVAIHPFRNADHPELRVMTWNVHCPNGVDSVRQRSIAELILKIGADFVLLNEFNQDSCLVIDSVLRIKYPYTEEYQSHKKSGDVYYSKSPMHNSGHVWIPDPWKAIQTIKATVSVGLDSVQFFGVHMASNRYDNGALGNERNTITKLYEQYKISQTGRCFQAHWTKEAVLESPHPVIVMGDMNDFNCSAPLDTLTSCGMIDAWWECGNGYGSTFHDEWLRLRIDHILHSRDLKLESVKVINTNLSDHNPVVAGFSLIF